MVTLLSFALSSAEGRNKRDSKWCHKQMDRTFSKSICDIQVTWLWKLQYVILTRWYIQCYRIFFFNLICAFGDFMLNRFSSSLFIISDYLIIPISEYWNSIRIRYWKKRPRACLVYISRFPVSTLLDVFQVLAL